MTGDKVEAEFGLDSWVAGEVIETYGKDRLVLRLDDSGETFATTIDQVRPMKTTYEERAIALLDQILEMDRKDRDALPGSVVKLVKQARRIMLKRRKA